MTRRRCSHTYCYTFGAVKQEIRYPYRKHYRLLLGIGIGRNEINRLIYVSQEDLIREFPELGFGISVCRRSITLYRSEVAFTVYERNRLLEVLREHDHGLIY